MNNVGISCYFRNIVLGTSKEVLAFFECISMYVRFDNLTLDKDLVMDRLYRKYVPYSDISATNEVVDFIEKELTRIYTKDVDWARLGVDFAITDLNIVAKTLDGVFCRFFESFRKCVGSANFAFREEGIKPEIRIIVSDIPFNFSDKNISHEELDSLPQDAIPLWQIPRNGVIRRMGVSRDKDYPKPLKPKITRYMFRKKWRLLVEEALGEYGFEVVMSRILAKDLGGYYQGIEFQPGTDESAGRFTINFYLEYKFDGLDASVDEITFHDFWTNIGELGIKRDSIWFDNDDLLDQDKITELKAILVKCTTSFFSNYDTIDKIISATEAKLIKERERFSIDPLKHNLIRVLYSLASMYYYKGESKKASQYLEELIKLPCNVWWKDRIRQRANNLLLKIRK